GQVSLTTAAVAPSVQSGQTKTGTITGDFDVYSIFGALGGSIVASMGSPYTASSTDMKSRVQVFGADGQLLGTGIDPHLYGGGVGTVTVTDLPASGTYYVVASSADGDVGSYSFGAASLGL